MPTTNRIGFSLNKMLFLLCFVFLFWLPLTYAEAQSCVSKCKNTRSCKTAVYSLYVCGIRSLDRDRDGIPCESICNRSNTNRYKKQFNRSSTKSSSSKSKSNTSKKRIVKRKSDPMVVKAQTQLKRLGYYTSKIDGLTGPGTKRAVNKFRAEQGWSQSGAINITLIEALEATEPKGAFSSLSAVTTTDAPTTDPALSMVIEAQKTLKKLGFYKFRVDGKVGKGTIKAVKEFQESLGLEQTGNIDEQLIEALNNIPP